MRPTRISSKAAARRYVTANVAATLRNDFDSGAGWLHRKLPGDDTGNLDGPKSERLVQEAARELINQLNDFSKKKKQ